LSRWELQLPIGQPGDPETISNKQLEGCNGYQNPDYFFTGPDGSMVMKVPGSPASSQCVTTAHSTHCRTELREVSLNGSVTSWDPQAKTNRLRARLAVPQPDDSKFGTVVGQIHIDDTISTKPVCELYYSSQGELTMGVEQTRAGGNEVSTSVGVVPVGKTFRYEIRYEKNVLSVAIDDNPPQVLSTYELDAPLSYFKAGNYNQGDSPSTVQFYSISVHH